MWVVDASVVLRWFVAQQPGCEAAADWLRRFAAEPDRFAAPDLLRFELYGGLARLQARRDAGWAERRLLHFDRLGLRMIPTDLDALRRGLSLSRELGLAGWDALYLALAEALGGQWLTADGRALRTLEGDPRVHPVA